jgi:hypothetical protein
MDIEFLEVERAFKRGDPRPLAQWVLTHDMTSEQKEFVAKALCGEVEKIDGRKVKPLTGKIKRDYVKIKVLNYMMTVLHLPDDESRNDPEVFSRVSKSVALKDSAVAAMLANKYGFTDADSVRRAISRYKKEMKDAPVTRINVLTQRDPGHEKK